MHTALVAPVAMAAMHGTTDLALPPSRLYPYALLLWWPDGILAVTPAFLAASTLHFSHDIGAKNSVAMHACFLLLLLFGAEDLAFSLFAIYFCAVHTPMHYIRCSTSRCWGKGRQWWQPPAYASAICGVALLTICPPPETLEFTEWMQRLVIAHIVCDELNGD